MNRHRDHPAWQTQEPSQSRTCKQECITHEDACNRLWQREEAWHCMSTEVCHSLPPLLIFTSFFRVTTFFLPIFYLFFLFVLQCHFLRCYGSSSGLEAKAVWDRCSYVSKRRRRRKWRGMSRDIKTKGYWRGRGWGGAGQGNGHNGGRVGDGAEQGKSREGAQGEG